MHSEPSQTSKMEFFGKIFNAGKPLDVWLESKYASGNIIWNLLNVYREVFRTTSLTFSVLLARGIVVITATQLHSTKPGFCVSWNPARDVSEICDGENLRQWCLLEIKLNFCRSTIPQKQFIKDNFLRFDVDIEADVISRYHLLYLKI